MTWVECIFGRTNSSKLARIQFFSEGDCVAVCMCVRRMYVRAYLAIPCVLANDNGKHLKSNIRYVFYKKINKIK